MTKPTAWKGTRFVCWLTRRDFLRASTLAIVTLSEAGDSNANGLTKETGAQPALRIVTENTDKTLLWQLAADQTVRLLPPTLTVTPGKPGSMPLPVKVRLASYEIRDDRANLEYDLTIADHDGKREGKYSVVYGTERKAERVILTRRTNLRFGESLKLDLTAAHTVQFTGKQPVKYTLPLRYGVVKDFALAGRVGDTGYFVLGRGSTSREGEELALPVIGLGFGDAAGADLAIATDPYCGSQFSIHGSSENAQRQSLVTTSYTYTGSLVPIWQEERTEVFVSHKGGTDGVLSSFYDTIPEIHASPSWVHDIQLNYYDDISAYKSEPGEGWYRDVLKLAEKIPAEHRGKVVLCLEGYYDYLGRYSYDHAKRQLDREWDAYDMKARKVPMRLAEVHKRIKFAKDHGFRVVWYFADGMASDTTSPYYRKEWVIKDETGKYPSRGFWQWRPDTKAKMPPGYSPVLRDDENPTNHLLDPGNPEVVDWFVGYLEALLKEFGRELDGFTWDETFLIKRGQISTAGGEPTYSDRAYMRLVSRLSQLVQEWRKVNPDLVFLTSDMGRTPYALVAHGTYQDSACYPQMWPPCLLINYRNCLWSCNWTPVTGDLNNHLAARMYGLPQGLSNGFRDDQGPSEMPEELLDRVLQRFLRRIEEGHDRVRYLLNVLDGMDYSPIMVPHQRNPK